MLTQVLLPEALRGGEGATLGTYPFTAGLTGTVELTDTPNGYVVADAIRFIRR